MRDAGGGAVGFSSVDLTDRICPGGACVPSVGNVWVYLDDDHLTTSYVSTLAPAMVVRMRAQGSWPGGTTPVVAGRLRR